MSILGEGDTPVVSLDVLAHRWGVGALLAKAEHINPTGSYKDRIAAATMTEAVAAGRRGWVGTSSGNGGAAMAAYGRKVGLRGVLLVSQGAPAEKLASIRPYGVTMISVSEMGPEVMADLTELAREENLVLTITTHAHNPTGMVGARGIGAELAVQHPEVTHVYVPSGGGGLLVATATGLAQEGSAARVISAQPAGCAPISRYVNQELDAPVVDTWETEISGLQLPRPPDGGMAADAILDSGGWGAYVEDESAWRAQEELAQAEGVFVEPATAVALAAVRADAVAGRVGPADCVSIILTGSGLKDLTRFSARQAPPDLVEPTEVADIVRSAFPRNQLRGPQ